jgi:hypothetical protein
MNRSPVASLLVVFALTSCETTHRAAVSTFRVLDAPNVYIRRQLGVDEEQPAATTTTTTTQTAYSDTANVPPQQPYPVQPRSNQPYGNQPPSPPPVQTQRRITEERETAPAPPASGPTATPRVAQKESRTTEPQPTTTPRTTSTQKNSDFPYAKPVPGKPGYVYSPFDPNGGYVDVKGYAPGQKVKDPYSGKIFLVP